MTTKFYLRISSLNCTLISKIIPIVLLVVTLQSFRKTFFSWSCRVLTALSKDRWNLFFIEVSFLIYHKYTSSEIMARISSMLAHVSNIVQVIVFLLLKSKGNRSAFLASYPKFYSSHFIDFYLECYHSSIFVEVRDHH